MFDRLSSFPSQTTPNGYPPLRVAVVASSLKLAGAEKQTVYMTRALLEAGLDVRFYYLGEGGYYEPVLRKMKMPFLQIYKPNRPVFMLARLTKALWQLRPHIVFAPQFGDLLQAGIAGNLCSALTLGGLRSDGFYELNTHGKLSGWMLWLAHGLIANSEHARHNLASRGANPQKIKVLLNVIHLGEFDARSELSPPFVVPLNRVMAVAVGSLHPSKRFDRFLTALARAQAKAPALLGVIAGPDRGSKPALEQKANELGRGPNHLVFVGECDNVPALLAQDGFLVLCSDYEGFPNVILEAMAAQLPVIAAQVGDAGRIVLQDRTGYMVNGNDVGAMAGRMVELALSPATRRRLGTEGRKRVAQEYNYDSLPARLLSVLGGFAVQNRRSRLAANLQTRLPPTEAKPASERDPAIKIAA